jgi:glycosyltransferase involved in cell wall biosynthesis
MNEKKICFISCVNDHQLYKESLYYINQLEIPEGYEIECISVENAESMTQGYSKAMKESDARYKVYLHQDVYIINKSFIKDTLDIFNSNEKIGMLGMAGAKTIPTNGVWWESTHKYGEVYESHTGKMELLQFNEVTNNYEEVKVIDGLIMITKYDIPWRDDIFDGWHFYDVSQSVEFTSKGYKIVIPKQEEIWCIHDCGILNVKNGYEYYRNIFLEEHSKFIYPLVSILIPTYNRPKYLQLALESVLNQTYRNIEIIIGDDSTNKETERLIKENYLNEYDNIKYYHNEKNLGQFDNDIKLYDMANGQYINYLMDDDLFEVTKIQKMMNYFVQDENEEISLVTSHRGIIDGNGNYNGIFGNTEKIFESDTIVSGTDIGNKLIISHYNFIGEPTTVLFRKKHLLEPFGVFNGRKYGPNVDQASWLNLLSEGKAVYINEVLSYFRIHEGQQQHEENLIFQGQIDHVHKLLTCRNKNFMKNDEDYIEAIDTLIWHLNLYLDHIKNSNDNLKRTTIKKNYNKLLEVRGKIENSIKEKMPLVSILIPAYNQTKYLREALESAINQTYPNIEIIIGDDSSTDEVEKFIIPYLKKYKNITYFKNEREEIDYGYINHINCFKRCKGEYVNFLNHDDVFHPRKIEKMMECFFENTNITLVTSVRQPVDENGNKLALNGAFTRLFDKDTLMGGHQSSRYMVTSLTNYIGEPTTVLFKKRYINENRLNYFNGVRFKNIGDVANWFTLLQYGDLVYISEPLSYFRIHSKQNSQKPEVYIQGVIAWYELIKHSYETGIIKNLEEYKIIINKWLTTFIPVLNKFVKEGDYVNSDLKNQLSSTYEEAIKEIFYRKLEYNFRCPICNNEVERFLPYQYKKYELDFTNKYDIIGSDTENFTCPHCHCHDRMRHIVMYFNQKNIWKNYISNRKVMHIAPEIHLSEIIALLNPEEYICADLYPTNDSIKKLDVTNIPYQSNYFDFIMCNHVLEHISDDLKAMKELYRVLKKGGCAVLQTPYSPKIAESFEDKSINTDELRNKFYGQSDHVRIYGLDFFERLKSVGFSLDIVKNDELFTQEHCKEYGVNYREDLILVKK